jgi:malonyl-CoA O-methyltransferase
MRVALEFSRYASQYNSRNIIQAKVAQKLLSLVPKRDYSRVIDIGCGRGEVHRNLIDQGIPFAHLTAMDISKPMLHLHPSGESIIKIEADFNSSDFIKALPYSHYDLLLSSSALQWSQALESTLAALAALCDECYFAIFTSETFRSLQLYTNTASPIYDEGILKEKIGQHFDVQFETVRYKLNFDTPYQMLRYIKESGASGGRQRLGYKELKRVIENYPYKYLEFEVLYASPRSKKQ